MSAQQQLSKSQLEHQWMMVIDCLHTRTVSLLIFKKRALGCRATHVKLIRIYTDNRFGLPEEQDLVSQAEQAESPAIREISLIR